MVNFKQHFSRKKGVKIWEKKASKKKRSGDEHFHISMLHNGYE